MDEIDATQNRSNDDAESKSSDENENSFIGKMKFSVSKILPNSLSKWLSPKVDATNARRRRHEEIDSDDEHVTTNSQPLASVSDERYQTTPQLGAPPPNKKKKMFTDFLSRNPHEPYSPLIGDRNNIASSTLIEDVPHRSNNQFNRYLPLENGQHAVSSPSFPDDSVRDNTSNFPDEASSSQSRDKPANPFAINNASSVVNFSANLQRANSLFNNRSYISPRLKNYRMRNPRSSLYRSTSSLCDNNSVSSNASSAMSSLFYNGQIQFGGASATSRRMNTMLNQDTQLHHRPKVPTNLVTSRSTSSLNSIGGSASMSNTAKRILEVMNKYSTPLTEVRRISNALPSIAEASALNKRKSILALDATTNETDKSKRSLIKPNTPYNRPFGRNPAESVLTTELHVPTMPELLQLKMFAANTMKIRDIASNSGSVLNKPASIKTTEFKMTKPITNLTDKDLDASNNNKSVNSKFDSISNSASDASTQHKNKIRSNLTKRRIGKSDDKLMPEPVNLPNIQLKLDNKTEPFKLQMIDQKTTNTPDNGLHIPLKLKTSNANLPLLPPPPSLSLPAMSKEKQINGNSINSKTEPNKKLAIQSTPTILAQTNSFSTRTSDDFVSSSISSRVNDCSPKILTSILTATPFRFSEPIVVKSSSKSIDTKQPNNLANKFSFSFSQPTFVLYKPEHLPKTEATKSFSNFSKSINKITSDSGIAETTLGSAQTAKSNVTDSKDSGFSAGKPISSLSTAIGDDDSFKSIVAKQKLDKWSCKDCFAANPASVSRCECCGASKVKATTSSAKMPQKESPAAVDDVFKSIVAKQKQTKWQCNGCFAQNDQTQNKCLCCNAANPNASVNVTASSKAAPPKSTFSFGTLPSSSSATSNASPPLDNTFKAIVAKQKSTWSCSACLNQNDESKSKCVCCDQSREVTKGATSSGNAPAKAQFSFGTSSIAAPKSTFSFGSAATTATNVASTFSFGNSAAVSTAPSPFSFGNEKSDKPTAVEAPSNSEKSESEKEKEQKPPVSSPFSFGNPTTLPLTSKTETIPKPPASEAPVQADNVLKAIAEKQNASQWECSSCMAKNPNEKEKCACCQTLKGGSTAKDTAKKDFGFSSNQKFSFGTSSSSPFSFTSQPENKVNFKFGASASTATTAATTGTATEIAASTTSSTATLFAVTTTTPTAATTANLFGSVAQKPMFGFSVNKPANEMPTSAAPAPAPAIAQTPSSGFQFSFGLANTSSLAAKEISKDVTDTGPISNTNNKSITVLDNILVKPATNGPADITKPLFSFGQTGQMNQSDDDQTTKAKKRTNTDLESCVSAKLPASSGISGTPFIFGQTQTTNNIFGAMAAKPDLNTTQATATETPKPTFSFGSSQPSTSAFPTVQTTVAPTPFAFGASNTAPTIAPTFTNNSTNNSTPAPPTLNSPSQPTFGSNAFSSATSSLPSLGGFRGPTFGSSTPAFGTPSPNTEAQQQATSGPFQFGAGNTNANALQSAAASPPSAGGFNFTPNAAPTFNFTEQNTQQPSALFQFGAAPDPNIFSVQPTPSASATAIQQRRRLRTVRRVRP